MIFTVQVPSSASGTSTKELVTALTSPNVVLDTSVEMLVPSSSNGTTEELLVVRTSHRNELLKDIDVYSHRELTPNCKKLYFKAMKLKKKSDRLLQNKNKFKYRVQLTEKFAKSCSVNNNDMLNKLNTTTLAFFHSQIKSQTVKPRGRRFSLQDKILSLSIFKNSPKAYRFLSTIFALPSKKTLTSLLNHVTFEAGINDHIIKNLTHQATRLKPNDRLCSLVFDEMAIAPATAYNIKDDMVYGFENFGRNDKNRILCDHVLVFLLRGIHRKWKQPIAYYFCQSVTKTPQLIKWVKGLLAGLMMIFFIFPTFILDMAPDCFLR